LAAGAGAYNNNNPKNTHTHTHIHTQKTHKTLPKTHFQKTTSKQPTNNKIGIIIGIIGIILLYKL
jgi:hypothetical protein